MTKHEAILEADDRNFTINFGPQGVMRLWEGAKYVLPGDEKSEEA